MRGRAALLLTGRRACATALVALALCVPVACSSAPDAASSTASTSSTSPSAIATSSTAATSSPAPALPTGATPGPSASVTPTEPTNCLERLVAGLNREQRVGQLLMVGAQAGAPTSALDATLRERHLGGIVLLGTWSGRSSVATAAAHWQQTARATSGALNLLVAADQEGGEVQHLRGAGFSSTPSALTQGSAPGTVEATAARTGSELKAAGVNVNLAPVADTVSPSFAGRNAPIGAYRRQFGGDPETVSRAVTAAVDGLQEAGVSATLKHFPGLGRIAGNTDFTATGTTDTTTTVDDPWLEPFRDGIRGGVDLVMVSSAIYSRIDPENRAVFSRDVVTDLLRGSLGYDRVVITDDLGGAKAVASVPMGERATRFIAAGGDIVLTGLPSTIGAMTDAVVQRAATDPAFRAQVDAAARRVVALKVKRGLATCS